MPRKYEIYLVFTIHLVHLKKRISTELVPFTLLSQYTILQGRLYSKKVNNCFHSDYFLLLLMALAQPRVPQADRPRSESGHILVPGFLFANSLSLRTEA
jgi:hypothetical protein